MLLDEPTDGVDPVGRRDIRQMCQTLKDRGKTVFLNSHLLSELEMICDRVAILVQGRVASQGTIDSLTTHRQRYEIEVASDDSNVDTALRGVVLLASAGCERALSMASFRPANRSMCGSISRTHRRW